MGVVGGPGEIEIGRAIAGASSRIKDLTGQTDYAELAALGARAALAVGNDTGPTHLIASTGASTLVLFSAESDPSLCAPRGRNVEVLSEPRLSELSVDRVEKALEALCGAA